MTLILFEMRTGHGDLLKVVQFYAADKSAARMRAGHLAAREKCGVDLYYAAPNEQYISTAAPDGTRSRGFRFERLT